MCSLPAEASASQFGLTLPSRGRVPAGFARFHTPLMSNVRPRSRNTKCEGKRSESIEAFSLALADRSFALVFASVVAARSSKGHRKLACHAARQDCCQTSPQASTIRQESQQAQHRIRGASKARRQGSAMNNRGQSLLLHAQRAVARGQCLRPGRARVVSGSAFGSRVRPNPSIEGTCSSKLRLLEHAPHVKR